MAAAASKPVMVIGVDDSECAIATLEWTLDQFFSQTIRIHPFKLVVVHVKPSPDVFVGFSGSGRIAGSVETYQAFDGDLKRKAARTIKIAREICSSKSVCDVEFEVEEGDARYVLCEAAIKHRASVLVVGSRGHGGMKRAFLGSVSDYCVHQAPCTVMIVKINHSTKTKKKEKTAAPAGRILPMATEEKQVIVIGVDDSEYATYALEWTLDHFFSSTPNPPFKLVVVYAKPFPDVFVGVGGPGMIVGSAGSYQFLNEDLKKKAALIIATARGICESKSVNDVKYEVDEGDARNVLCQAVDKHNASMLVVGSHGYGALKRAFLGSVSDYCAHQASCTVMIVKKLKTKEGYSSFLQPMHTVL